MMVKRGHAMNARNEHEMVCPNGLADVIIIQTNRYLFGTGWLRSKLAELVRLFVFDF